MTTDTTNKEYWLNWRFLLCATWVFSGIAIASILIWMYERGHKDNDDEMALRQESACTVYADECWRPCLKHVHPAWLLLYRILSFFILLTLITINILIDGVSILLYYTQWTFLLVMLYFAIGSVLSINGCHQYQYKLCQTKEHLMSFDRERKTYIDYASIKSDTRERDRDIAGFGAYTFQIVFQINAGAVMLTDCVFWLVIFPVRSNEDHHILFLLVLMHSVNVIFLIGDMALNSLRFPWFRVSYFLLWTALYVIFQWIIHAYKSFWWPYPFLDLSSSLSPIWYLSVALLHIPCYAAFQMILKLKNCLLASHFRHSYLPVK